MIKINKMAIRGSTFYHSFMCASNIVEELYEQVNPIQECRPSAADVFIRRSPLLGSYLALLFDEKFRFLEVAGHSMVGTRRTSI